MKLCAACNKNEATTDAIDGLCDGCYSDRMKMEAFEVSYDEELCGIYSDMFKSLNGFRPRGILMDTFFALSTEDKVAKLERLSDEVGEECERERAEEAAHAAAVEAARDDPNGFVWEADYGYDFDNEKNLRSYIVPGTPPNSTMRDALTSALVTNINTSATTALADLL